MKRRIIALVLIICMLFLSCGDMAWAVSERKGEPTCSCDNGSTELAPHADDCARKTYCRELSANSVEDLYAMWKDLPTDIREFILTYLSWTDWNKYQTLSKRLEDFTEEPKVTETPVPTPSVTETPVPTPSVMETPVPTPSVTETPVPTPEVTETATPTPSITETVVPTPEVTGTPTPSVTAGPTPTDSPKPTAEPTPPPVVPQAPPSAPSASVDECECETRPEFGSVKHKKECSCHFANISVKEEYILYITMTQEQQKAAKATLTAEKKAELEAYIAANPFASTVSADGVKVITSSVPQGAKLTAKVMDQKVTEELLPRMTFANQVDFALDITLYDASGKEWQPESGKSVMVKISVPEVKVGDNTNFIHILDKASAIKKGIAEGSVGLIDISYMFVDYTEEGEQIEVTPNLPDAYWDALEATESLGYSKQVAYEIIAGTCYEDGYSVFYTGSFSAFSNSSLGSGTYYIKWNLIGQDGDGKWTGSRRGYYTSQNADSQRHQYYYDSISGVTIPSGTTVNFVFVAGSVPVSGAITVNGTLNVSLYNGTNIPFYSYQNNIWGKPANWREEQDKTLSSNQLYHDTNCTVYRASGYTGAIFNVGSNGTLNLAGQNNATRFIIEGNNYEANYPAIRSVGKLNLDYVTIQNNRNVNAGGGIWMDDSPASTLDYVNITGCRGKDGIGINITQMDGRSDAENTMGSVNANYCNISNCFTVDGELGGTVRSYGNTRSTATFTNCNIYNNKSGGNGGGFYWNAGGASKLTINSCKIYGNSASQKGGGVFCESVMEIKGSTEIYNNTAQTGGGGICVNAYAGSAGTQTSSGCNLVLASTISVYNNSTPKNGGGIFMYVYETTCLFPDATFTVKLNGANISNNTAENGGGVCILRTADANYKSTANLDYGKLENNTATSGNGGGVYTTNTDVIIGNDSNQALTINGNKATNGIGGAVYSQGNIGSCNIKNGTLTSNSAKHGGAIGVVDSVVTVNGGKVDSNTASGYGGAIYTTGTSSGIAVSGQGSVSSNTAANGGGIYATGGATVTISGGTISKNSAKGTPSATTAYSDGADKGVGGGIYVGNGTDSKASSITISGSQVGLHSNDADFAAADAYASGKNTKVTLPGVSNMNLSGYNGSATGWYEDYANGDTGYTHGFMGGTVGERYASARTTREITSASNVTKYAAITLGTTRVGYGNLTISKTGTNIDPNQVFVFSITGNGISMEVSVVGKDSITIYDLPDGTYTVKENTGWSWRYTPTSASSSATISATNVNPTVTFNNNLTNDHWLSVLYQIINAKGS